MTTYHQFKYPFTFTPDEVKYLVTTQHFAEERATTFLDRSDHPNEAERVISHDVVHFGSRAREAAATGQTTIPIKMGVLYW
jgi:hypothetical protein